MGESIFALDTAYQFYMSLLVKYLEKNKKYDISRLIQKAGFEIHTGYEQDSYEGTYYHKVIVLVDQDIFVNILDEKDSYTQEIKNGINKVYNKDNEFIAYIDIAPSLSIINPIHDKISIYTQNKLPSFKVRSPYRK